MQPVTFPISLMSLTLMLRDSALSVDLQYFSPKVSYCTGPEHFKPSLLCSPFAIESSFSDASDYVEKLPALLSKRHEKGAYID